MQNRFKIIDITEDNGKYNFEITDKYLNISFQVTEQEMIELHELIMTYLIKSPVMAIVREIQSGRE